MFESGLSPLVVLWHMQKMEHCAAHNLPCWQRLADLEAQAQGLREELVQANQLRKQQLMELGLLREEEKQKTVRDHEAKVYMISEILSQGYKQTSGGLLGWKVCSSIVSSSAVLCAAVWDGTAEAGAGKTVQPGTGTDHGKGPGPSQTNPFAVLATSWLLKGTGKVQCSCQKLTVFCCFPCCCMSFILLQTNTRLKEMEKDYGHRISKSIQVEVDICLTLLVMWEWWASLVMSLTQLV